MTAPIVPSPRQAIEAMLADQPDDASTQAAYADFLVDEGDPRGEYIQLQTVQHDLNKPVALRRQLQARITQLYARYEREWLGGLAPFLLDPVGRAHDPRAEPQGEFEWHCGWIDKLTIPRLTIPFAQAVAQAPELRLLRDLSIHQVRFRERQRPAATEADRLAPVLAATNLGNLRRLRIGDFDNWGCAANVEGLEVLVARLPRLEELALAADGINVPALVTLPLGQLTQLRFDFLSTAPLELLAHNRTLTRLHTLHLDVRANERQGEEVLPIPTGLSEFAGAAHLRSIRHLRLRLPSFGDEGLARLVAGGWLERLETLDLRGASLSDESAQLLANTAATLRLRRLNVGENFFTAVGVAALEALDLPTLIADQPLGQPGGDDFALDPMQNDIPF